MSVSRRAFVASSVQVFVFFCETAAACKTVWAIAIAQHQFYLDRKARSKPADAGKAGMAAALTALVERRGAGPELLRTTPGLEKAGSSPSLDSDSGHGAEEAKSEEEKAREMALYKALQEKKAALEAALQAKLQELKAHCIQEGTITGEVPPEIKRTLGPGEPEPRIQRRVGTSFAVPHDVIDRKNNRADAVAALEADIEIQRRICAAANKLSSDKSTNKSVRRKRQRDFQAANSRLKGPFLLSSSHCLFKPLKSVADMEAKLVSLRISASKPDLSNAGYTKSDSRNRNILHPSGVFVAAPMESISGAWPNYSGPVKKGMDNRAAVSCPTTPRGSLPDLLAGTDLDDEGLDLDDVPVPGDRLPDPAARPPLPRAGRGQDEPDSLPASPLRGPRQPSASSIGAESNASLASLPIYENIGYKNSLYQSSYRKKQYPTLAPNSAREPAGPALRRMTHLHRTHSEHSLASLPSSELQPLPDYRTYGSAAVEHSVGAYNIPHQRTSWNFPSAGGLESVTSSDSIGADSHASSSTSSMRYGFGASNARCSPAQSRPPHPPPVHVASSPAGLLPNTTSLDRRLLRSRTPRNKVAAGWPPDLNPSHLTPPSSNSPKRVPVPPSPLRSDANSPASPTPLPLRIRSSGTELVKPLETADVLKYSRRLPNASPTSPGCRGRPPPPPYNATSPQPPLTSPPPPHTYAPCPLFQGGRREMVVWTAGALRR